MKEFTMTDEEIKTYNDNLDATIKMDERILLEQEEARYRQMESDSEERARLEAEIYAKGWDHRGNKIKTNIKATKEMNARSAEESNRKIQEAADAIDPDEAYNTNETIGDITSHILDGQMYVQEFDGENATKHSKSLKDIKDGINDAVGAVEGYDQAGIARSSASMNDPADPEAFHEVETGCDRGEDDKLAVGELIDMGLVTQDFYYFDRNSKTFIPTESYIKDTRAWPSLFNLAMWSYVTRKYINAPRYLVKYGITRSDISKVTNDLQAHDSSRLFRKEIFEIKEKLCDAISTAHHAPNGEYHNNFSMSGKSLIDVVANDIYKSMFVKQKNYAYASAEYLVQALAQACTYKSELGGVIEGKIKVTTPYMLVVGGTSCGKSAGMKYVGNALDAVLGLGYVKHKLPMDEVSLYSDVQLTTSRLASTGADIGNTGTINYIIDEGGKYLNTDEKTGKPITESLLQCFGANPIDRKTRQSNGKGGGIDEFERISSYGMSVMLITQPKTVQDIIGDTSLSSSGLIGRFQFALLDNNRVFGKPEISNHEPSPGIISALKTYCKNMTANKGASMDIGCDDYLTLVINRMNEEYGGRESKMDRMGKMSEIVMSKAVAIASPRLTVTTDDIDNAVSTFYQQHKHLDMVLSTSGPKSNAALCAEHVLANFINDKPVTKKYVINRIMKTGFVDKVRPNEVKDFIKDIIDGMIDDGHLFNLTKGRTYYLTTKKPD